MADPTAEVLAAGGVVWKPGPDGRLVLIVHRPKYDDWSLPKGKLHDGEGFAAAALREIEEETGVVGELGEDLGEIRYVDHKGRDKLVRWWSVRVASEAERTADDEVDDQRWVELRDVDRALTYSADRAVVDRFRATVVR